MFFEECSSTSSSSQLFGIEMQRSNHWEIPKIKLCPRSESSMSVESSRNEVVMENAVDEDEQKGKELIMDMFLKSAQVMLHVIDIKKTSLLSMNVKKTTMLKKKFRSTTELQTFFNDHDDEANLNAPNHIETDHFSDFYNYSPSTAAENRARKHQHFHLPDMNYPMELTGQYCEPNFQHEQEDWGNMAQGGPYFETPQDEPVGFMSLDWGFKGNHGMAQNFPAPAQFTNYPDKDYMARRFDHSKHPAGPEDQCDLGCWCYNQGSDYGHTVPPQPDFMKFEENLPNFNYAFGKSSGNNAIDLIEANNDLNLKRKEKFLKTFKENKPDFPRNQYHQVNFNNWNFVNAQKHQVEFNSTNFLNIRKDPSTSFWDQTNVTEFNRDFMSTDRVQDNPFQIRTHQADDPMKGIQTLNFQDANENKEVAGFKQSNVPKGWGRKRQRKARKGRNLQW